MLFACSKKKTDTPLSLVPELTPQLVEHLTTSDDSTFAAYGREIGWWQLINSFWDISGSMMDMSPEVFEANVDTLDTYLFRIGRVLESEYHYKKSLNESRYLKTLSHKERCEVLEKRKEWAGVMDDPTLSLQEKIDRQYRFIEFGEEHGERYLVGVSHMRLSALYSDTGRDEDAERHLRIAYDILVEIDNTRLVCQILGVMGSRYQESGDVDSMIVCYEKARKIATRCRIPGQTARIYSFYAGHYYRQGRLALAYTMHQQAIEWCREFKGGHSEIRYILTAMTYYERLGCWDICERNLARARLLEKRYSDELLDVHKLRLDRFEARLAMAHGDVKKADAMYKRIQKPVDDLRNRLDLIEMLFNWGRGLVDNGRPGDALPIIDEGCRRSKNEFTPEWTPRFALLEAEAQFETGDLDKARASIKEFDSLASHDGRFYSREWMHRDALLGRIELAAGDRDAAELALESGFNRLHGSFVAMDPSVHSYLWIGEGEGLRQLMHDLVADDPVLGYGAEMLWRDFYRELGYHAATASADRTVDPKTVPAEFGVDAPRGILTKEFKQKAVAVAERVAARKAIHSVYRVHGNEVWRWTAAPGGIRRDVLDTTPEEIRDLVSSTYDKLSRDDDGAKISSRLRKDLRKLGRILLPEEVLTSPDQMSKPMFLVTADCCLGRIPFGTFDTAENGPYTPLLLTSDVAYLRFADPAAEAPPVSNGVIVVNPRPSDELQKRFPFQQELEEAAAEGRAMAALDPAATYLEGDAATKPRLQQVWGDASYIYLAAHTLRDPVVPYLVLIPMAVDTDDAGPDAAYLDILDIRTADLSKCRVAILSGCSSGVPYVAGMRTGPSLGDAFLDSGVCTVVQTFWDVKDDDARALMTSFVKLWKGTCLTEIRTLCEARRRAMISPDGVRHPSSWASYSIKLGRL